MRYSIRENDCGYIVKEGTFSGKEVKDRGKGGAGTYKANTVGTTNKKIYIVYESFHPLSPSYTTSNF